MIYIDEAHEKADREIARMERKLRKIYSEAAEEIGVGWKRYLDSLNEEGKTLLENIGKAETDKDKRKAYAAYNRYLRLKTTMSARYKSLTEKLAKEISGVNRKAAEFINGRTPKVYADTWNWNGKSIETGCGSAIRFDIINENTVMELLAEDADFLPAYEIDPAKDIPWNIEKINSEVAKGIINGDSIPAIKSRLETVCGMNEKSSERAARTVVTAAENKARMDTAKEAEEKGVKMRKMWISAHDSRVRPWHEEADRDYHSRDKAIEIDEPFIVNGEELMYPADPSGSPKNVYNCRCTTAHVIDGFTSILPPERRGKIRVTFE